MKVTVKDIALKAGVSTATVSLVLNNKPSRISDKTRERIISIAREENYKPNQIAASMLTRKTRTVGLIVPDMSNPFFNKMAIGVERYAYTLGYNILLCNIDDRSDKCFDYLNNLAGRCVDGIILIPPIDTNKKNSKIMLQIFNESKIPMVLLDRAVQNVFCDFITLDNKQGGYLATEYLLKLGHRRVGCITSPAETYSGRKRLAGYKEAISLYKLPIEDDLIFYGDYHTYSGEAGARVLIGNGATAIFACNDMMAIGVYRYALANNIKIPDDLSIVGFDNIPLCDIMRVPLTSVDQPAELMGKRAFEILMDKITGNEEMEGPQNYYFSPSIVERSSTKTYNKQ
jgi:LacI family transcriptional regulator